MVIATAVVTAVAIPLGLVRLNGESRHEPADLPPVKLAAGLTPFDACPAFLSYVQSTALDEVGPYGFRSGDVPVAANFGPDTGTTGRAAPLPPAAAAPMPAEDAAAGGASASSQEAYSGTNVQVADVDEPDSVKTDGRMLVSLDGNALRVLDVTTPRLRGALTFAEPVQELLLVDNLAVVFGEQYYSYAYGDVAPRSLPGSRPATAGTEPGLTEQQQQPPPAANGPAAVPPPPPTEDRWGFVPSPAVETSVTVVDLAEPDRPQVLRTFRFTGSRVAVRVVDGTIRFVLRSLPPTLNWTFPTETVTEEMAVEANRRLVEQTSADDWLPRYRVENAGAAEAVDGPLVACEDVLRPETPGDLSMISVLTVDPNADSAGRATAVVGGGHTVYAEQTDLYVADSRYPDAVPTRGGPPVPTAVPDRPDTAPQDPEDPDLAPPSEIVPPSDVIPAPTDFVTQIHQFDVSDPEQARYVASGQTRGRLLNSYAMSAADGRLRVATTRQNDGTTDNAIVVLAPRGQELTEVGQVGGLGAGEQIYAVRYLGDVAWVVTFRQVDPLYAVDLSDPTRPTVRGELKLPGFSTFLLPLPGDRLLGVGESADRPGGGTKLVLIDISDLSAPRLVDDEITADTSPLVSSEPHAFLWWEPTGLAVVPATGVWGTAGAPDQRALAFRIDGDRDTVAFTGRLGREGEPNPVTRAVVVGDRLFAVSTAGVQVHHLADLTAGVWVPW